MKKILIFSLMSLFTWALIAQDVKIEKTQDRSFYFQNGDKVDIVNKYGEIIVRTWYKDSVRIMVKTEARGKNQETVNREMRRVEIEMRKIGNIITSVTHFDRGRTGLFGDLLSQVEDAGKSIVGGSKITVDYEVWLPEDADLSLENKFGDIYLVDLKGNVDIDLSHGDLRGNTIDKELALKHSFGKNTFDFIKDGNMVLRGVETKVNEAHRMEFESSSSEIEINKVYYLVINSRNDKYTINEARDVIGEGSFTDMTLDYVVDNIRLEFNYGDVYLTRIDKDFNAISLTGKSSDINLILDQASYIKTYIVGQEDKMILPNSMLVLSKEKVGEENNISLSGFVGNTNTNHSNLEVNAQGGELIIAIKETTLFTNKDE